MFLFPALDNEHCVLTQPRPEADGRQRLIVVPSHPMMINPIAPCDD
jgi:hypothetical protein